MPVWHLVLKIFFSKGDGKRASTANISIEGLVAVNEAAAVRPRFYKIHWDHGRTAGDMNLAATHNAQSVRASLITDRQCVMKLPDTVRLVGNHDGGLLLDITQHLCFSLSPVASAICDLLKTGALQEQVICSIAEQCPDLPRHEIEANVTGFLNDLHKMGLLVSESEACPTIRLPKLLLLVLMSQKRGDAKQAVKPGFLFWKALVGLFAFDVFGFDKHFTHVYAAVKRCAVASVTSHPEAVERICKAINYACVVYPKRVLCLQRSAVTTFLLRRHGIAAQMVMGAQKFPFKAHAWTEVSGLPINERRDVHSLLVWERI